MTRLYLYAITDGVEAPLPTQPGIEDQVPQCIAHEDLAAWVSPCSHSRVPTEVDNVWRHESVIEELMQHRAVLPVRFGTVVAGQAAIEQALMDRRAALVRNLERVRHCVELSLRVLWHGDDKPLPHADLPPRPPALPGNGAVRGSGRDYMMARLGVMQREQGRQAEAKALASEIDAPLGSLARDSVRQVLPSRHQLMVAAYLLSAPDIDAFRRQVDRLVDRYPQLQFLCTGPWPAYNFVSSESFARN